MFVSWAKKCGLLNSDGTPNQLYKDFRNPNYRTSVMATALKKAILKYMNEMSMHMSCLNPN
jgi:Family of unknown function (DUF5343)